MIRRPPRSTLDRSSAASDVYKRQGGERAREYVRAREALQVADELARAGHITALAAQRLRKRTEVNIDLVVETEVLRHAAAVGAEQEGGVGFVDHLSLIH